MNPRFTAGAIGAAGLLAVGGVAFAATGNDVALSSASPSAPSSPSSSASGDIVLPAGGALATRITSFCAHSDQVIARIEKRQAVVDVKGDAVKARLEKRVATLKKHGHGKRAAALAKRIDRRATRVARLPDRLAKVQVAAAECRSLNIS